MTVAPTRCRTTVRTRSREKRRVAQVQLSIYGPVSPHPILFMPVPFSAEQRTELLQQLGVAQLPTPDAIKQELERDWLLPSSGARKELSGIEWAMYVPSPSILATC